MAEKSPLPVYTKRILNLAERIAVIEQHKSFVSITELAKIFNCGSTQISRIIHYQDEYIKQWNESPNSNCIKAPNPYNKQAISTVVCHWCATCLKKGFPLTLDAIRQTARKTAKLLQVYRYKIAREWIEYIKKKFKSSITYDLTNEVLGASLAAIETIKLEDLMIEIKDQLPFEVVEKLPHLLNGPTVSQKIFDSNDINYVEMTNSNDLTIPFTVDSERLTQLSDSYTDEPCNSIIDVDDSDDQNSLHELDKSMKSIDTESSTLNRSTIQELKVDNQKSEQLNASEIETVNLQQLDQEVKSDSESGSATTTDPELFTNQSEIETHQEIIGTLNNNDEQPAKKEIINDIDFSDTNYHPSQSSNAEKTTNSKEDITILNYKQALQYLKPLEEFALLNSDFRAANFISSLENLFKEQQDKS